MDFSKLDARAATEISRPLHIRDLDGALMYDTDDKGKVLKDKPCRVMVKGASSKSVQDAIRDDLRRAMKAKGKDDNKVMADYDEDIVQAAARLVTGFENMKWDGKPMTAPDHILPFLRLTFISIAKDANGNPTRPSFAQQVLTFASDDAAFLASALKP